MIYVHEQFFRRVDDNNLFKLKIHNLFGALNTHTHTSFALLTMSTHLCQPICLDTYLCVFFVFLSFILHDLTPLKIITRQCWLLLRHRITIFFFNTDLFLIFIIVCMPDVNRPNDHFHVICILLGCFNTIITDYCYYIFPVQCQIVKY